MPIITYNLAPIPRWYFADLTGKPLGGGFLFSYRDSNRSQFKPIYSDINGMFPYAQGIPFDENGEAPGIFYFASDEFYFLEIYDSNMVLQFTVTGYNAPGQGGGGGGTPAPVVNIVRNPQFTWFDNGTVFNNYTTTTNIFSDFTVDDWFFSRNNNNATITMSQQVFPLGQTLVPGSPVNFYRYSCTNTGAGSETFKYLGQFYDSVQTFAGQQVSISFWAQSSTASQLSVTFQQYFGTGGSPSTSVTTPITTVTLTSVWTQYTATITLPGVAGKTQGTNLDDALLLLFNYPLNAVATIDLVNVQLQPGNVIPAFQYISQNEQFRRLDSQIDFAKFYTGDILHSCRALTAAQGWLSINSQFTIGNTLSNADYKGFFTQALFLFIWTTFPGYTVFDSTGTPVSRGASAQADYDANRRLNLPSAFDSVIAAQGVHALGSNFGEEQHTLLAAEIPIHTHLYSQSNQSVMVQAGGTSIISGTTSVNTGSFGGGGPHNNVQPTLYLNIYIKL